VSILISPRPTNQRTRELVNALDAAIQEYQHRHPHTRPHDIDHALRLLRARSGRSTRIRVLLALTLLVVVLTLVFNSAQQSGGDISSPFMLMLVGGLVVGIGVLFLIRTIRGD
jgi:hypothetical protein